MNGTSSTRKSQSKAAAPAAPQNTAPQNTAPAPAPAPAPIPAPAPVTPPPAPKVRGAVQNNMSTFSKLTPDQQADMIEKNLRTPLPIHMNSQSSLQHVLYGAGLTSAPDVVDDATFRRTAGSTIYRTVNNVYDGGLDLGFSAPDIAQQTMKSGQLRLPHGNTAVYGEGIYFAKSRSSSTVYGNVTGNISKTCVIESKFKPTAKIMSYNSARTGAQAEMRKGSKLGKALKKCSDPFSVYALSKGYQAMDNGMGYLIVMDRSCLVMNSKVTPK